MAGVSEGTVDRILHGRPNVSAEALTKVNEVLERINYKPNLIARSLGKAKGQKIAVIIPEPDVDPYWAEVNFGIEQAVDEWSQYGVAITPFFYSHNGQSTLEHVSNKALESNQDGIVMAPIFYPQALAALKKMQEEKIPYVLFNDNISESNPLCFIGQDLWQSGMLAGELMSLGQEGKEELTILHIDEDVKYSVYLVEKERGFRDFYENQNPGHKVITLNLNMNDHSFKGIIESLINNKNIKGFFVTTSRAVSVVAGILAKSSRKDLRLIGYDMLSENLKYLKNGTIRFLINQNPKRQAFLGISHMANYLLFKKKVPATDLFPLEIITQQNVDSYIGSGIH